MAIFIKLYVNTTLSSLEAPIFEEVLIINSRQACVQPVIIMGLVLLILIVLPVAIVETGSLRFVDGALEDVAPRAVNRQAISELGHPQGLFQALYLLPVECQFLRAALSLFLEGKKLLVKGLALVLLFGDVRFERAVVLDELGLHLLEGLLVLVH